MVGEYIAVRLLVFFAQVTARSIWTKPARIHAHHIHGGFAVNNPICQLPAGAAGRGDAKTMPFIEPEIFQPPGGADDGIAVGGVGDGAVVNLLDADFAKRRDAINARFNMRLQPLQIAVK